MAKKVARTIYTPMQICYLEEKFAEHDFPNKLERKKIADHLLMSEHHVQIWFQNKRAKQKRKEKKRVHTEKKVHIPKPPSFWPQNLSFNSTFQVIANHNGTSCVESQAHSVQSDTEYSSKSSSPEPEHSSWSGSSTITAAQKKTANVNSPASQMETALQYNNESRKRTNGLSEPDCHHYRVSDGQRSSQHTNCSKKSRHHNGSCPMESSAILESHQNHHHLSSYESVHLLSNPLLLLANCATQLHSIESADSLLVSQCNSRGDGENIHATTH